MLHRFKPLKPLKRLTSLTLSLLLTLPAGLLHAQTGPRKLALIIGIDHYGPKYAPAVPLTEQWSSLDGSSNDAKMLGAELERRGFDVLVVTNEQATHAGIVAAFRKQLVEKAQAGRGDVVFFHYSGHGQQIPDDNGAPDEADGYDEALVPFDNRGTKNYSNHVRDDEIGTLIAEVQAKTDNIAISLDSCHSGTATRGLRKKRGMKATLPPAKTRGGTGDGDAGFMPANDAAGKGYVFLAAVRADQEANEDEDPVSHAPMGAYTLLLVQALQDAGPKTTYQELLDRIGVQIVGRVTNQNPQIEGDSQKVLFSGEWKAASKYFRTRPLNDEGQLPIEAGSLHGLQVGSELDVIAPGAVDGQKPLARVKIVRVELGISYAEAVTVDGKLGKLDAKSFDKGAQAIEMFAQHVPGQMRIVNLGPAKVTGVLQGLKFVAMVDKRLATAAVPQWDVRVVEDAGAVRLERADGSIVPIPRGHNQKMDLSIAPDDPDFEKRVRQAIEALHRRNRVVGLDNPDANSRMDVVLTVTKVEAVLETGADGKRRPKITKTLGTVKKDGNDRVKVGEILQLHVQNKSDKAAFVTILELSTDGSVGVLFPFPGTSGGDNLLKPGEKRDLAVPFKMTPPGGPQIFKVIATEDDIDFRALEFQVKRGAGGGSSPLQRMMGEVFDGKRSEPFGYAPDKLWGTDAARIELVE